jgi:hypothetical protein
LKNDHVAAKNSGRSMSSISVQPMLYRTHIAGNMRIESAHISR